MKSLIPLIALAAAVTAFAGVSERGPATAAAGAPTAAAAKPQAGYRPGALRRAEAPAQKGRSLRCWQQGRLIFEEPVAALPSGVPPHGHVFEGKGGAPDMQLLDLQHAACLIR